MRIQGISFLSIHLTEVKQLINKSFIVQKLEVLGDTLFLTRQFLPVISHIVFAFQLAPFKRFDTIYLQLHTKCDVSVD